MFLVQESCTSRLNSLLTTIMKQDISEKLPWTHFGLTLEDLWACFSVIQYCRFRISFLNVSYGDSEEITSFQQVIRRTNWSMHIFQDLIPQNSDLFFEYIICGCNKNNLHSIFELFLYHYK